MDSSVSPKDEIWFLRVCHHISNAVYLCIFPVLLLLLVVAVALVVVVAAVVVVVAATVIINDAVTRFV